MTHASCKVAVLLKITILQIGFLLLDLGFRDILVNIKCYVLVRNEVYLGFWNFFDVMKVASC